MIHIDLDTAKRFVREAIEDKGEDYVYRSPHENYDACLYVHGHGEDRTPGCIVAHALVKAGVPLDALAEHEQVNARDLVNERLHPYLTASADAATFLDTLQSLQDDGISWGEAFRRFNPRFLRV